MDCKGRRVVGQLKQDEEKEEDEFDLLEFVAERCRDAAEVERTVEAAMSKDCARSSGTASSCCTASQDDKPEPNVPQDEADETDKTDKTDKPEQEKDLEGPAADEPSPPARTQSLPGAYAAVPGTELQRRATTVSFALVGAAPCSSMSLECWSTDGNSMDDNDACYPRRRHDEQLDDSTSLTTRVLDLEDPPHDADDDTRKNRGLVEARLVVPDRDLPQAEDCSELWEQSSRSRGHDRKEQEDTKLVKTVLLMGALVLLAVSMVLVAVLVPTHDTEETLSQTLSPSAASSMAPSFLSLEDRVKSLFEEETLVALEDPDSPQSMAFQWLLQDTERLPSYSDDRIIQKFALATFYYATHGDHWNTNTHWLNHSAHECDWFHQPDFGKKATTAQMLPGYLDGFLEPPPPTVCNDKGLYQHVWLDQNELAGSLPDEFFLLTSLKTVSLSSNAIKGSIPATRLGKLTALEGLALGQLPPKGTIPTQLGLLSNLKVLFLAKSQLEGSIPTELWTLTNLMHVVLNDNPELTGTLPAEMEKFSHLKWLIIDQCSLSGTLPSELGQLPSLEWLVLSDNQFSGTIPTETGRMASLSWFVLDQNRFAGHLPSEVGILPQLMGLSFCDNSMEGNLPSELGHASMLYALSICNNQITGPLPSELGLLTGLGVALNARGNQLSHSIPTELGLLSRLIDLDLSSNQFTGRIPGELGELSSIGHLGLAENYLSGTVPVELSLRQQSLHTLELEGNALLSGTLPVGICNISGTCVNSPLGDNCGESRGLLFDCTDLLCGCGCSCNKQEEHSSQQNSTAVDGIPHN
ncbi:Leucine Rich Repeat [Seminavis robusta]|uniref:Leucine Rich Repeat n=1 Tax=Seminavis robusta TaxID=568900 RepID=A0A9N8D9T9_9STRA|nr:Leucine Rich Repeat [Seminavis robusta]|eukprot:Sro52_g030860.1 Leucine Rich Repeat (808) ;mRNA; f:21513-24055